jgi:hypothetical protein
MSHWAEIDLNNKVLRVLVGDDLLPNEGELVIKGLGGTWVKTSYNTFGGHHILGGIPLRKNFAGIGYFYDQDRDAFIAPKPYPSWILNEETCIWNAPVEYPEDGNFYKWNEENQTWDSVEPIA